MIMGFTAIIKVFATATMKYNCLWVFAGSCYVSKISEFWGPSSINIPYHLQNDLN